MNIFSLIFTILLQFLGTEPSVDAENSPTVITSSEGAVCDHRVDDFCDDIESIKQEGNF